MLLITAKKEPPVAGQLKEEPAVNKESQENQESTSDDSQQSADSENKDIHSGNTDQNEALQDKHLPQTGEESTASSSSSEQDETPVNPRVVSVGQDEVFCAATGRPCSVPSGQHAHEHNADSAGEALTSNSEAVDSEIQKPSEDSSFDSGSETRTEATQSSQITNDSSSSLENEQNTQSTEHKNDEKDERNENVDATMRT